MLVSKASDVNVLLGTVHSGSEDGTVNVQENGLEAIAQSCVVRKRHDGGWLSLRCGVDVIDQPFN